MVYNSYSDSETIEIARGMGEKALPGEVYCLCGALGVGKTVFAKGFAAGLGVENIVTSPTFVVLNEYNGRLPLYHMDMYRIEDFEKLQEIGFEEYIGDNGVCLIEWADLIAPMLPSFAVWIYITVDDALNCRLIEVN